MAPRRIGTRGSPLALAQANETRARLLAATGPPEDAFEIAVIRATGAAGQGPRRARAPPGERDARAPPRRDRAPRGRLRDRGDPRHRRRGAGPPLVPGRRQG